MVIIPDALLNNKQTNASQAEKLLTKIHFWYWSLQITFMQQTQ